MRSKENDSSTLILESSLQTFFFDRLQEVNKKSNHPVSNESIYYLSIVMDQFGESAKFFEEEQGRIREKMLGVKLLESSQLPEKQLKRSLREIGDTALFVCGYFYDSLNSKLIDISYYENLGQIAYKRLDSYFPQAYEVPAFFKKLSTNFNSLTNLVSVISRDVFENDMNELAYLITDHQKIKIS